jgi:hypothetical protein
MIYLDVSNDETWTRRPISIMYTSSVADVILLKTAQDLCLIHFDRSYRCTGMLVVDVDVEADRRRSRKPGLVREPKDGSLYFDNTYEACVST